jgi:hypothetical protein
MGYRNLPEVHFNGPNRPEWIKRQIIPARYVCSVGSQIDVCTAPWSTPNSTYFIIVYGDKDHNHWRGNITYLDHDARVQQRRWWRKLKPFLAAYAAMREAHRGTQV